MSATLENRAGVGWPQAGARSYPVVEVFGPTIQGEGPDAGRRCWFVRLGGCDYRCAWCDSMHAVTPALVRQAPRRTPVEIAEELYQHGGRGAGDLVVLSGGNPALHRATGLVRVLRGLGYRVSVETQGSMWRPWLGYVDRLVVSPKPPSSSEATPANLVRFERFLDFARQTQAWPTTALKIVVFDRADYAWARELIQRLTIGRRRPGWVGLSCGTDSTGAEPVERTAARYRWLCETVAGDRDLDAVVLPQLHVIAWGHALGR